MEEANILLLHLEHKTVHATQYPVTFSLPIDLHRLKIKAQVQIKYNTSKSQE